MLSKNRSLILVALTLSLLTACSTFKKPPGEPEGEAPFDTRPGFETVVILGTNDLHGTLSPIQLRTHEAEGVKPTEYEAAGAATLASYIRILRSQYGDHLLWLDGGDEFQGSIESNLEQGAPMVKFLNFMGLNAAAIGNHEFDFGVDSLKARMTEAHYPYLDANIEEKETGRPPAFPGSSPRLLLTAGKLKIGVIGLSTTDTPKTTRPENVRDFKFADLKEATIREAAALRHSGAQIVVITAHAGLKCQNGRTSSANRLRKPTDPLGGCGASDEMVHLLKSLPEGTVDAVVSGHTHQVVHHWIAGVPVIQGGVFGRYFNLVYLTYDWNQKKVLPERTRIEGPVPVCPLVFEHQGNCNGDRPAPPQGRGKLVPPYYHGQEIRPDSPVVSLLAPTFDKSSAEKSRVVGQAASDIEHERFKESPLGNLVADSLREATQSDAAIVNSGGIRAPIDAGPITYGQVFRSIPFENSVSVLTVSGKELKTILRVAESGDRGFPPISGLAIKVLEPSADAPASDLNGDGKIEPWEINRLVHAEFSDGSAIHDQKKYRLATLDFLVSGGDDFAWPMSQIPASRIGSGGITVRDAVLKYLAKAGPVNSTEHPLVDPQNPRIRFVKSAGGKRHRRRRAKQG